MSIKKQINQDLKQAMLAGDKTLTTTLRGLKSAILYVEVAKGARDSGLPEAELIDILSKEAKKRQESADMYIQGDSPERAAAETAEKTVIEKYLPAQLSEEEISGLVSEVIAQLGASDMSVMGQVIGAVKERTKGSADGAIIAKIVKEKAEGMILLMGIAGSGKGTQSKLLAEKDNFNVISTGELLRVYGSDDQHARMLKGEILNDAEVTALLEQALSEIPDPNNVILDGYPRRISQAQWLLEQQQKGRFKITSVVHLIASKEAVKARLVERARPDDHDDGIEQRFAEYERDTVPILDYLATAGIKVREVNAEQSVETVHQQIVEWLKNPAD